MLLFWAVRKTLGIDEEKLFRDISKVNDVRIRRQLFLVHLQNPDFSVFTNTDLLIALSLKHTHTHTSQEEHVLDLS